MKTVFVFLILGVTCVSMSAAGPVSSFTVAWMLGEDPGTGFEGSPAYCDLDGDGQDEAIVVVGSGVDGTALWSLNALNPGEIDDDAKPILPFPRRSAPK